MDKMQELERDLKVAYLNYQNDDLKETIKYLDRMLKTILEDDKTLDNDPFWKNLACEVFKAVVLNNFYNKRELTLNDLDSLLANKEEMKKNIKEFCDNFKNQELIDFTSHIRNISDNPLKDAIKILMVNIGKMNITDGKIEILNIPKSTAENDKVQKIDCFCGKSFTFDWSKISNTTKIIYMRCPHCNSELKRGNPYYVDIEKNNSKSINEIINQMKLIEFSKINEAKVDNKLIYSYHVHLFRDSWFTFDFMIYASKCYKNYNVNFFNQDNKCVTADFINANFSLDTDNIQRICNDYHLNFSMTYFLNEKGFTATKLFGKDQIIFVTSLDEKGVDLNDNIELVKYNYLIYTQSEHIYWIIKNNSKNEKNNKINLSSGYILIQYMLSLKEDEYDTFYNENIKWIEKSFDFVKKDKEYWESLLEDIKEELIKLSV